MERVGKAPDQLYDHEILEALLFFALPRVDTNPLAHRLLQRFGDIQNVLNAEEGALCSVDGVGVQVANFLRLQGELHRRMDQVKPKTRYLKNSRDARLFVRRHLGESDTEKLLIVFLSGAGKVLSVSTYSNKKKEQVETKVLDMIQIAAALRAKALVLAHNHPSGNPKPSEKDIKSTETIDVFCKMCGITLFDHVIVSGTDSFSFRDEGLIDPPKM